MRAKHQATAIGMGLMVAIAGACAESASSVQRQGDGVAPLETSGASMVRAASRSSADLEKLFPEFGRTLRSEPQARSLSDLRKLFPELDRTLTAAETAGY
jgi:hypothetical protein